MSYGDEIPDRADYTPRDTTETPTEDAIVTDSQSDRMRIHNAKFRLITADLDESTDALVAEVERVGGFVESRSNATVLCRVPVNEFKSFTNRMSDFGDVSSREISAADVTDEYHDLGLRLKVLEASHGRILSLIDKAEAVEDIIKLEEKLAEVTTEIETLKGQQRAMGRQVSYSTIEVQFAKRSTTPTNTASGRLSPFTWINELEPFQGRAPVGINEIPGLFDPLKRVMRGKPPIDNPDGFMVVKSSRRELWSIAADNAAMRYREFDVPAETDLEFWTRAVKTHLIDDRGFRLVDETRVNHLAKTAKGVGYQMLFETETSDGPVRYLATISLGSEKSFPRRGRMQVTEFSAPVRQFAEYQNAVANVMPFPVAVNDESSDSGMLVSSRE